MQALYRANARPYAAGASPRAGRAATRTIVRAGGEGTSGINEDVLARLKAAEEEAAALRKELAAAQGPAEPAEEDIIERKPGRVDSTGNRETVFDVDRKDSSAWLSESDLDFFTGGAPVGESGLAPVDPEMEAVVQKRLIIGGLITAGFAALALIPTEALRLKPPQPMYFYVVPLLRIRELLGQCEPIIADADWGTLRLILPRVSGPPNDARTNLGAVVALLEDAKTAEKAGTLAAEFNEYLDSIDYNKYYETMPRTTLTGAQNAQFADFSGKALKAALAKLDAFLKLVPPSVMADALVALEN